jgi:AcrR family transcriptional regulator
MSSPKPPSKDRLSTKGRLLAAALELFIDQGIPATTTKAIAERAEVNEVTLFRHFGNKNGLLLGILAQSIASPETSSSPTDLATTLTTYSQTQLQTLDRFQKLIHSLIGEASQFPPENRQALHQTLQQINQQTAQHLSTAIAESQQQSSFAPEILASLLHSLLLGYSLLQTTHDQPTDAKTLEAFVTSITRLFLEGAIVHPPASSASIPNTPTTSAPPIADLPASLVRTILQRAQKHDRQTYAFVYTLFATGLSATEILNLDRAHYIPEPDQHLLQVNQGHIRQVPLNQWIAGKRYGSDNNNPLHQWLKSRKDEHRGMFLSASSQPLIAIAQLDELWQAVTADLLTPQGHTPTIAQAQQTWCVEMLVKGIEPTQLSLLSGLTLEALQPFQARAAAKIAIESATKLDRS